MYKPYFHFILCAAFVVLTGNNCKSSSANSPTANGSSKCVAESAQTPQKIHQLFQELGVEYGKQLKFSDDCSHLAHLTPDDYSGYKGNEKMHDRLTKKYGPMISQGYKVPLSVDWINETIGYGVFYRGKKVLKEGEFVITYIGEVCRKAALKAKYSWSYPSCSSDSFQGENYSLDGAAYGNEARFINHSDDPNLVVKLVFENNQWYVVYVVANGKEIGEGNQFTISYGAGYWKNREKVPL